MDRAARIIPAYHISRQSNGDGMIEDEVNSILRVIEDDVRAAMERRVTLAITEMPTSFSIPNMMNDRAQMHIYYHVLKALREAQYDPKIRFSGSRFENQHVYIHTRWLSKEDREMEQHMDKYIKSYTMGKKAPTEEAMSIKARPISRRRRK